MFIFKKFLCLFCLIFGCASAETFEQLLADAALERTLHEVSYDGSYYSIDYPNGDVPQNIGVCTDVIIRAYRVMNIDLQQLVHNDMSENFVSYPSKRIWGLNKTDKNIDHRRVPNLQVYFSRHGNSLPVTHNKEDYLPGDIVTWLLANNLPHIGVVVGNNSIETGNPLVVHNIGLGPKQEDMLFKYKITGHYRYKPTLIH